MLMMFAVNVLFAVDEKGGLTVSSTHPLTRLSPVLCSALKSYSSRVGTEPLLVEMGNRGSQRGKHW